MKVELNLSVDFTATLKLSETELKALDALAGYGTDELLKCFYTHMGKAYLEPHEAGLRSMFKKIKDMQSTISSIDESKKALSNLFRDKK